MSTFADPEIIKLLQTRFVPVAIDQWYTRRQKDAEGEYYRKVARQGPRKDPEQTTQGLYVFTAGGKLLGYTNNRGPDRVKRLLDKTLKEFKPGKADPIDVGRRDPKYDRSLPEGMVVVDVTSKVLGGYEPSENKWQKLFRTSLGRDHLWIRKDEVAALGKGRLMESLMKRMASFHLVDNTRGEPPHWRPSEITTLDTSFTKGRVTGTVHLETDSGDRGFRADLLGYDETDGDRLTRFDLVVRGQFWGEGRYTRDAPKGKFPFAVAFTLADPKDEAAKVPPQGARWLPGYIR